MIIQAEVSIYPLRTNAIEKTVETFIDLVSHHELNINRGTMSTTVTGDISDVFSALNISFGKIASSNAVVMVLKISNACPLCSTTSLENNMHNSDEKCIR